MDRNNEENYQGIDHDFSSHLVEPFGLLTEPDLVLKLYAFYTRGSAPPEVLREETKAFLGERIERGDISRGAGYGFALLSSDYLNVAVWNNTIPILPLSKVYNITKGFAAAYPLNLNEESAFCAWELMIAAHEAKAWVAFQRSNKGVDEKQRFLNDRLCGPLGF